MSSKIALAFKKCEKEKRPALVTYTVAGDDTKENSLKILNSISKHADIIELGFAHNTPIADGSQIQESAYRALKNGIKLNDVFQIIKKFKARNPNKPLIMMGYFNLIYQIGENKMVIGQVLVWRGEYTYAINVGVSMLNYKEPNQFSKSLKEVEFNIGYMINRVLMF